MLDFKTQSQLVDATAAIVRAMPNGAAQRAADDGGFASYRSAGGHASTQVIIGS